MPQSAANSRAQASTRHPDNGREATYWDIGDVQYHCRVSRSTAWRLVKRDDFPEPVVFGRRLIWPRVEIVEFMEEHRDRAGRTSPDGPREWHVNGRSFAARPVRRRAR